MAVRSTSLEKVRRHLWSAVQVCGAFVPLITGIFVFRKVSGPVYYSFVTDALAILPAEAYALILVLALGLWFAWLAISVARGEKSHLIIHERPGGQEAIDERLTLIARKLDHARNSSDTAAQNAREAGTWTQRVFDNLAASIEAEFERVHSAAIDAGFQVKPSYKEYLHTIVGRHKDQYAF